MKFDVLSFFFGAFFALAYLMCGYILFLIDSKNKK